ncbi:MAG: LacI family transcriptional regulator [Lachnospiraceae bacterium]|nr:LacI family transcriptional regulator [Lachnospiraceae bacterium]
MILRDIAKEAGVSTATVSNVINGNFHKVSQETIEKVQKIIEDNDYKPSTIARSLARKESKIIGVVMPNLGEEEAFSVSPYNTQILALLENYIRRQGYYMMIRSVKECKEIIPLFSTWYVDGMIFMGAFKNEVEDIQSRLEIPAVYIDSYVEELDIANVGIDDYKGGFLAARYLIGKGHRKIAFAGPNINSSGVVKERYRGFCDACRERGIEVNQACIFEAWTLYEYGVEVGKRIAFSDEGFTAVAAMSDILAFGIMEGLRLCGLNVPGNISVVGFDNLPECRYSYPKLTTVSQNLEKKALLAGECLFKMIRNKEKVVTNQKVDVEIIERQSVREIII